MPDNTEQDYRNTEQNPVLLSTTYKVQTNWHVIAGGPSSGKTTLIGQLSEAGYQTIPETARLVIEREMDKGLTIDEVRESQAALQCRMIDLQHTIEGGLRPDDVIFLDRGIPDHFPYCRVWGVNPNHFLGSCFHYRYASVFILAPLPFQENGARDRDAGNLGYLDEWTTRDYRALGYNVARVPVLAPEERLAFVLERVFGKD